MSDPAIVRKWLSRRVRGRIRDYWQEYFAARTYLTDSGVWIMRINHENETGTWLIFAFEPVRMIEHLNSRPQDYAGGDWSELVEVAAWTIQLDDPNYVGLAKQVANELASLDACLCLQHDKCTSYRKMGEQFHPLRQILFS